MCPPSSPQSAFPSPQISSHRGSRLRPEVQDLVIRIQSRCSRGFLGAARWVQLRRPQTRDELPAPRLTSCSSKADTVMTVDAPVRSGVPRSHLVVRSKLLHATRFPREQGGSRLVHLTMSLLLHSAAAGSHVAVLSRTEPTSGRGGDRTGTGMGRLPWGRRAAAAPPRAAGESRATSWGGCLG